MTQADLLATCAAVGAAWDQCDRGGLHRCVKMEGHPPRHVCGRCGELFTADPPLSRTGDRATAVAAGEMVRGRVGVIQREILRLYVEFGPMTPIECEDRYCDRWPKATGVTTVRKRCSELLNDLGLLTETGERRNRSAVLKLTESGRAAA